MTRLPARLLFLLALLSLLSLPARAQNLLGGCDAGVAEDFEIGLAITDESYDVFVTVTNEATGLVEDSRWAYGDQEIGGLGCHWVAHVGEPATGPGRAEVSDNAPLTLHFKVYLNGQPTSAEYSYTYSLCHTDGDLDSFYCPDGGVSGGDPDLFFYFEGVDSGGMRVYPTYLANIGVSHTTGDVADPDYFTTRTGCCPCRLKRCALRRATASARRRSGLACRF